MTRSIWLLIGLVCVVAIGCWLSAGRTEVSAQEKQNRVFEMRIYTTHPGKLKDLHQRFKNHTNRIFKKHGMQLVGYWTPIDKKESQNTLVYILAYPSKEAGVKAWQGFRKDPEWTAAFKASRVNGPIVKKVQSKYMTPTDYSPIK